MELEVQLVFYCQITILLRGFIHFTHFLCVSLILLSRLHQMLSGTASLRIRQTLPQPSDHLPILTLRHHTSDALPAPPPVCQPACQPVPVDLPVLLPAEVLSALFPELSF